VDSRRGPYYNPGTWLFAQPVDNTEHVSKEVLTPICVNFFQELKLLTNNRIIATSKPVAFDPPTLSDPRKS
jgi:hypothetical protein